MSRPGFWLFLPPQSPVSQKAGPWWGPGREGTRAWLCPSCFWNSLSNCFAGSLSWRAHSVSGGVLPAPWQWVLTSDTPWDDTLRPHLRAQLTKSSGALPTPLGSVTTLPIRDHYQGTHWPKSLKCPKETTVSSPPKSSENCPFLSCFAWDIYWLVLSMWGSGCRAHQRSWCRAKVQRCSPI